MTIRCVTHGPVHYLCRSWQRNIRCTQHIWITWNAHRRCRQQVQGRSGSVNGVRSMHICSYIQFPGNHFSPVTIPFIAIICPQQWLFKWVSEEHASWLANHYILCKLTDVWYVCIVSYPCLQLCSFKTVQCIVSFPNYLLKVLCNAMAMKLWYCQISLQNEVCGFLLSVFENKWTDYTVEPLYNTIVFHQNTHKRRPIARP